MKKLMILSLVVLFLGLVPKSASALTWYVTARIFATERPESDVSSFTNVRSSHMLSISINALEITWGTKANIAEGQPYFNSSTANPYCRTSATPISRKTHHSCSTSFNQVPCEDGIWHAVTRGIVKGGICLGCGSKTTASPEKQIICGGC